MKELFGTHVSAPFLPPLDLQRVNEGSALLAGCCLYFVGAWLSRRPDSAPESLNADGMPDAAPSQLASGFPIDGLPTSPRRSKDRV